MTKILAITGGSGSGKTALARAVAASVRPARTFILSEDRYYYDVSHMSATALASVNFDVPEAKDLARLEDDLAAIRDGRPLRLPDYCFKTRRVTPEADTLPEADLIILEGLHALSRPGIRAHLDGSVFLDVPEEVRLCRRLMRDVQHRGRTVESVLTQYLSRVAAMHREHVEPLKAFSAYRIAMPAPREVAVLDARPEHFEPEIFDLLTYVQRVMQA